MTLADRLRAQARIMQKRNEAVCAADRRIDPYDNDYADSANLMEQAADELDKLTK